MLKILIFSVLIIILILIIGWEIHLLRTDPRTSNKILFSIIPIILFVFFGYLLYLGIDREIYLHSAEATMETGVDGECFNLIYRDSKKREVYLWCDDGSIEFDGNINPTKIVIMPEGGMTGYRYHAKKAGEAWVVVWIYMDGNARPRIEDMEFYHLTVDTSNNIEYVEKDAFLPAFLLKNEFIDYGIEKVVITKENKSVKIFGYQNDLLEALYKKFQLACGENYWSNPFMPDGSEYHVEIYYDGIVCQDFYISTDGIMHGKYIGMDYNIELKTYYDPNQPFTQGTDIEFIPDEDSSVDEILLLLDDLLANY